MSVKNIFNGKISAGILALVCCFLWGSVFPILKLSFEKLNITEPFGMIQIAGYRYFISGVLVLLFSIISNKKWVLPSKKEWRIILIVALLQSVGGCALNYIGLANTTSAKASIITSSEIFFTIIITHFFTHNDRLTFRRIIGMILGIAGLIAVNITNDGLFTLSFSFYGEGLMLGAAIVLSIGFFIIKKRSSEIDLLRVNGWQLIIGSIILIIIGCEGSPDIIRFDWISFGQLIYLAIVTAIAFSLWFILLKYNYISKITIYKFSVPISGTLLSMILITGEVVTWAMGVGLILVVAGIVITNLPNSKLNKRGEFTTEIKLNGSLKE